MKIKKHILVSLDFEIDDLDNVTVGDVEKQLDVIRSYINDHFSLNPISDIQTNNKMKINLCNVSKINLPFGLN